jgi:SAM-dependent methyltransferase
MSKDYTAPMCAAALREWYQRPLGHLLAETELAALAAQLPTLFGYYLLVIDPPWENCSLKDSRIPHHIVQSVLPGGHHEAGVNGHTDDWPVMTDTIDAVILPHTLELTHDPHQVLREADRSLIPDGHLVILGFNPRSLWGLRRVLSRRHDQMPWGSRFLSMYRVQDWLGLLGFDTVHSQYLFHRPPVQNVRLQDKLRFLESFGGNRGHMLMAASYILVARKRTVAMTPVKPGRAQARRLFPVGIPSSSQGNVRRTG